MTDDAAREAALFARMDEWPDEHTNSYRRYLDDLRFLRRRLEEARTERDLWKRIDNERLKLWLPPDAPGTRREPGDA